MRWGGGFIYNKLFFSFYNIENIKGYKNISFYTRKNKNLYNISYYKLFNHCFSHNIIKKYNKIINKKNVINDAKNLNNNFIYSNYNKKIFYNNRNIILHNFYYYDKLKKYLHSNSLVSNSYLKNYNFTIYKKSLLFYMKSLENLYDYTSYKKIYNDIFYKLSNKLFENLYLYKSKDFINFEKLPKINKNINNFKNMHKINKNINDFKNISNYLNQNNKLQNKKIDKKYNDIYSSVYEKNLEQAKNLDYDFIFDKIKEMIFEEIAFMCDI